MDVQIGFIQSPLILFLSMVANDLIQDGGQVLEVFLGSFFTRLDIRSYNDINTQVFERTDRIVIHHPAVNQVISLVFYR